MSKKRSSVKPEVNIILFLAKIIINLTFRGLMSPFDLYMQLGVSSWHYEALQMFVISVRNKFLLKNVMVFWPPFALNSVHGGNFKHG